MARSARGAGTAGLGSLSRLPAHYRLPVTGTQPRSRRYRLGIASVIAIAAVIAYLVSIFMYSLSGRSDVTSAPPSVSDGVNLDIALVNIDTTRKVMTLRMGVAPAGSYFDEDDLSWAKAVRVTTWFQASNAVTAEIPVGQSIGGKSELSLVIDGSTQTYPFDEYRFALPWSAYPANQRPAGVSTTDLAPAPFVTIEQLGPDEKPLRSVVVPVGMSSPPEGLQGWSEEWDFKSDQNDLLLLLVVTRSGGVLAFVLVVLALMIMLAVLGVLVARSVATKRRPIEATMASWFAALLFALVPLRNNLPGVPPVGAWFDVTVFYSVEIALMISMGVFIASWLKYRKPPDYADGNPI